MMKKALVLAAVVAAPVLAQSASECECNAGYKSIGTNPSVAEGGVCGSCDGAAITGRNSTGGTFWDTWEQEWQGSESLLAVASLAVVGTCYPAKTCNWQVDCSGHGRCSDGTTKMCECEPNYAGDKCDKCDDTSTTAANRWSNWPWCDQQCDPATDSTGTCGAKGSCTPEKTKCGDQAYDGDTQQCCEWASTGFWLGGFSRADGADPGAVNGFANSGTGTDIPGNPWVQNFYSGREPTWMAGSGYQSEPNFQYEHAIRALMVDGSDNTVMQSNVWVGNDLTQKFVISKEMTCCGWAAQMSCSAGQRCSEPNGLARCAPDNKATICRPSFSNGTARSWSFAFPGINTCLEPETCCDGACCDEDEECLDDVEPAEGWVFTGDVPIVYYGDTRIAIKAGQPLGYVTRSCSKHMMTTFSAFRIAVLPTFLLIFTILTTILVKSGRSPPPMVFVLSAVVIFFCIFLFFTTRWQVALLLCVGAWVAMLGTAASKSYPHATLVAFFVDMIIFFNTIGNKDWLKNFTGNNSGSPTIFNPTDPTNAWFQRTYKLQESCANYYNYFRADLDHAPALWSDKVNANEFDGYCSNGWLAASEFFAILAVSSFFMLTGLVGKALFDQQTRK